MQRGESGGTVRREYAFFLSLLGPGACAPAVSDPGPGEPDGATPGRPAAIGALTTEPSPQSRAVLQQAADYDAWPVFPEHRDGPRRSSGHGQMWVITHFNTAASDAVLREDADFPDGTILVMQNRPEPDAAATVLTTMAKVDGRWHWMQHTPEGEILVEDGLAIEGQVAGCIGCHAAAPRDMVFGGVWP